jgi:hypothetical protein
MTAPSSQNRLTTPAAPSVAGAVSTSSIGSVALCVSPRFGGRPNDKKPALIGAARPKRGGFRSSTTPGSEILSYSSPARGFALLSRKLGCGVDTKCPDIHPKPGRLESNSMSAPRRQEPALHIRGLAHNNEGRSLPRLQTVYPLPSRQQCRPLRRRSLRPQSGVYTPDKGCR